MSTRLPTIHVFHGNLGGTGKSLLASLLADHFVRQGKEVSCFYAGPGYGGITYRKSLKPKIALKDFDDLGSLDQVFESSAEVTILDCGPEGYNAFLRYIRLNTLGTYPGWLLHVPVAHSRLWGSRGGLDELAPYMPLPLVLWLNGHDGEMPSFSDALEDLGRNKADFLAMVRLTQEECRPLADILGPYTGLMTLSEMLQNIKPMSRARLYRFQEAFDHVVRNLLDQLS